MVLCCSSFVVACIDSVRNCNDYIRTKKIVDMDIRIKY